MPKRRLTDIAKDYNISFEQASDIAFNKLDESAFTGKGKNTWVTEMGQAMLDDNIPLEISKPKVYRGRVRNLAPNPKFAIIHIKEKAGCVPASIPRKLMGKIRRQQMVHIEEYEQDKYMIIMQKIV